MADYSKVVAWSGKDALADSDAAKVISGADFHTEFSAIETAVNTKADVNGDAAEAFSATTASPGTNTTQVASTAFVQAAFQAMYPVGSIYTNAAVSTNPATLLGFGTWAAYAEGRVPVGKASSGTFDTLNATGGAETHTLSIAEMPAHTHTYGKSTTTENMSIHDITGLRGAATTNTGSTGGGNAHNNLQPYIVVYMWKRTA
jgi:translation elongation factor EF-G